LKPTKAIRDSLNFYQGETSMTNNKKSAVTINRRKLLGGSAAVAGLSAATAIGAGLAPMAVFAQEKPPLRIVVGFPPGGSADILARVVADRIKSTLDRAVIVENKPGAGGRIALDTVRTAAPDGNTILLAPMGPFVLFPHTFKKLNYDSFNDFRPISQVASFQFAITAGSANNAKNIGELVALAKADVKNANYGTAGAGSVPHFLGVMLSDAAGVPMTHVPFQGGAPAMQALVGGHVSYVVDTLTESLELHKAGRARVIAVSSATRAPQLPDVPTLREQGLNMEATGWFGVFGPAKLPEDVINKISGAIAIAMKEKETQERLIKLGYEGIGSTPAALAAAHRADFARWEKPIKASGFTAD
jgi:tripartite-type tricarboxylate transporter receptor subunit TctC